MKRTIERAYRLPAFKCDLGALAVLIESLANTFHPEKPTISIAIAVRREEFTFDSVDDIRANAGLLPPVVRRMRLLLSHWGADGRTILLLAHSGTTTATASGPSTAWCAGATEVLADFAARHRRWYHWLRQWMLWMVASVGGFLPIPAATWAGKTSSLLPFVAFIIALVIIWLLFFLFSRVFPQYSLLLREDEHWAKKYAPEIATLTALLSLIVSIISLLL